MDFKNYLQETALEINQELDLFLEEWLKTVEKTSPKLLDLNKAFVDACQGGKRLRGTLCKLGYEIAENVILGSTSTSLSATPESERSWTSQDDKNQDKSQKYGKEIIKAGVAYEIFQTAILAHDDIIDKSDLRRGKKTLYKIVGSEQTICLGDIGFFLAFKILSETNFPEKEKSLAINCFAKSMIDTGLGEMLDIYLPGKKETAEEDILKISSLKTAKYTLTGPLQLGAVLAGADQDLLDKLGEFGEKLGIAFQIQDDVLGIFGEEKELGKSVTSDIEEGKLTLLYLHALEHGGKNALKGLYGEKIDQEGLEKVRQIFKETGALDYTREKAMLLAEEAKELVPQITQNPDLRTVLEQMADYLIVRNK